jgi:hypothetical protein
MERMHKKSWHQVNLNLQYNFTETKQSKALQAGGVEAITTNDLTT